MRQFLRFSIPVFLFLTLLFGVTQVIGQENEQEELSLRLSRDIGYGLGGQMQGSFSYIVNGVEDLSRVEFILDDKIIGEATAAPFRFRFETGDFSSGSHRLRAVGYKVDGQEVQSETITRQFIPGNSVMWIVIIIVAVIVLGRIISYLLSRSSKGSQGSTASYGFLGGAVCPNCGHPFGLHWWSLRIGIGRYDRCPDCRKWNMLQRASADSLAKAAEVMNEPDGMAGTPTLSAQDEDKTYQQLLDESRFDEQ